MQGAIAARHHGKRIEQFSCRVLVVDTDRDHSDKTVMFLERLGHQVRRAYSATTAVYFVRQFRPHVLLVDMTKPSTGVAVAAAMREREPGHRVRLVALTDWVDVDREAAIRGAGFDALLVKPVDRDALVEMLDHWCEDVRKKRAV